MTRQDAEVAMLRAEVERLRAELQTCRNKLKASGRTKLREDNAALRALLREALAEDNMLAGMRDKFRAALGAER